MSIAEENAASRVLSRPKKHAYAYRRVADSLLREIESGHYAAGDQLPTEKLLEMRFNVSRIVIRQAMGLLESERIIRREPGRGTFVTHRDTAEPKASDLPANSVVSIVSDFKLGMADPYVGSILRELSQCFSGASRTAALFNIWCEDNEPDLDQATLDRLASTDGILLLMPSLPLRTGRVVDQLLRLQKPVVGMNFSSSLIDTVLPDYFNGGIQAAEHLLALGHRRLLCLEMANPSQGWADRVEGFRFAVERRGGASVEFLKITPYDVHQQMCSFIDSGNPMPTAIFSGTDTNAVKVITALGNYGLAVPQDVSVMGYNDEDVSEAHVAPLTTIRVPLREMATHAARFLERRIASGINELSSREIVFATSIVCRESTAAPSSKQ